MKSIDHLINDLEKSNKKTISNLENNLEVYKTIKQQYPSIEAYEGEDESFFVKNFKFKLADLPNLANELNEVKFNGYTRNKSHTNTANFYIKKTINNCEIRIHVDKTIKLYNYSSKSIVDPNYQNQLNKNGQINTNNNWANYYVPKIWVTTINTFFDYEKQMKKCNFSQSFIDDCHLKIVNDIKNNKFQIDDAIMPEYVKALIMLS